MATPPKNIDPHAALDIVQSGGLEHVDSYYLVKTAEHFVTLAALCTNELRNRMEIGKLV